MPLEGHNTRRANATHEEGVGLGWVGGTRCASFRKSKVWKFLTTWAINIEICCSLHLAPHSTPLSSRFIYPFPGHVVWQLSLPATGQLPLPLPVLRLQQRASYFVAPWKCQHLFHIAHFPYNFHASNLVTPTALYLPPSLSFFLCNLCQSVQSTGFWSVLPSSSRCSLHVLALPLPINQTISALFVWPHPFFPRSYSIWLRPMVNLFMDLLAGSQHTR